MKTVYGTPIFTGENIKCKFYSAPKKNTFFPLCTNPKVGYATIKSHSMLLRCPDDCSFYKKMVEDEHELEAVKKLVEDKLKSGKTDKRVNSGEILISKKELVSFMKENIGESEFEYFRYLLRYLGFRKVHNKDVPLEHFLFAQYLYPGD